MPGAPQNRDEVRNSETRLLRRPVGNGNQRVGLMPLVQLVKKQRAQIGLDGCGWRCRAGAHNRCFAQADQIWFLFGYLFGDSRRSFGRVRQQYP
jgi:hypothetical protein